MWVYDSPVGKMVIKYDARDNRLRLMINDTWYGSYQSAVAAADDVSIHVTGCYDQDILDGQTEGSTDIYEWEKMRGQIKVAIFMM